MTRTRVQTPRIRRNRALGAVEMAVSRIGAGDRFQAAVDLERAATILREPCKDPAVCLNPDAPPCGLCDCWKAARAAAS